MQGLRSQALTPEARPAEAEDDAALVELARRDRQAFALLYRRWVARIYGYCYHRLGSRETPHHDMLALPQNW